MTKNFDNPAVRLLHFLEQGQKLDGNKLAQENLNILLNTEGNLSLLLSRLGEVMKLPEKIVETFTDLYPHHPDIWSHWHTQVTEAFLGLNIKDRWVFFSGQIDIHTYTYLRTTITLLDQRITTTSVDETKLTEIRDALHEIYEEVLNSEIDNDLRIFVLRKLREIIICCDEYHLTGLLPILDAVDSSIGHAATNATYADFLKKNTIGQKLRDALVDVANVITTASGVVSIASETMKLLSS